MPSGASIRLWYLLYNAVLHVAALVCLPYWLAVRFFRGRYRGQFRERMGLLPPEIEEMFPVPGGALWIHAASAGETVSAAPLVKLLKEAFPEARVLFTVTSKYGKEMAERRLGHLVDAIAFSPLDLPLFVGRFMRRIQPTLYVMVETEIWPNMLRGAKLQGTPVALASGHAGPSSFPRPFWRAVFAHVDLFLMQTESDAKNIQNRGASGDRVRVTGNMKFDGAGVRLPDSARSELRAEFGLPEGAPVFVCGSTLRDDEGPVLDTIAALRAEGMDLHAIIAPRRMERAADVQRGCEERGLSCVRRSEGGSATVLLLDTMGELARAYNVADVAYVGGGLTADVGLHNILEPAVCGVPVVFGAVHGKAARVAAEFRARAAGVEIRSGTELPAAVRSVLTVSAERERLRAASTALLLEHRGAAERQAKLIRELVA
ncbi:MAG: glycosyltransferase N-terminal domain-containing protein [Planctomycetota bacterium]